MRMMTSPLMSASPEYIEWLYNCYLEDPTSVDPQWRVAFAMVTEVGHVPTATPVRHGAGQGDVEDTLARDGHMFAAVDPLAESRADRAELVAKLMSEARGTTHESAELYRDDRSVSLAQAYLGSLSIETGHIDDTTARRWLKERFKHVSQVPDAADRKRVSDLLVKATEFERFLSVKYPTKKRFGAEGAEAAVALLAEIIRRSSKNGVDRIVLGTMHRGRLNIMANVLGEPLVDLLAKIKGARPYESIEEIPADVPYHLGLEAKIDCGDNVVDVSLLPNPSHLEAVNSVVIGRARALQDLAMSGGREAKSVLPIILHTDASVIGQGGVSEMIQLASPPGFTTLGTIHIIINNQIGFTTEVRDARSSRYCTGSWKATDSAIMHVNGDDPDAVMHAAAIAADYRDTFRRDAVVDLVCYRKNGHNEIDEPRFTQPLLYKTIDAKRPVSRMYAEKLAHEGLVSHAFFDEVSEKFWEQLQAAYEGSAAWRANQSGYPGGVWAPYIQSGPQGDEEGSTGIEQSVLEDLASQLALLPEAFQAEPKIARQVKQRASFDKGVPWPIAEALAYGSLLQEGISVRHSGQDIERGAFSHRHYAVMDQQTGEKFIHLQNSAAPGRFDVVNSPLSEYGVLAFEYGYSLARPDMLTIWEAQFGDFANGAQIIIDQFLTSGEDKWRQPSGLAVLLPHGLEGQGPEHSSARIERFLQMAARDNVRLANPTTPANYFHLLRSQVHGKNRKPLFVFSTKVLLRLPAAVSAVSDFTGDSRFTPLIVPEASGAIKRVIFCSGKFYYELEAARQAQKREDILIVRLEMLYPLPESEIRSVFERHADARYVWVQEEPLNMGAWSHLDRPLHALMAGVRGRGDVAKVGRLPATSPAGSFHGDHERDQKAIVEQAFEI